MNTSGSIQKQAWAWPDTIILLLLLIVATGLRFWAYNRIGIDHYDEGGYAMSAQAIYAWRPDLLYPLQHLLSPPLFFLLAGFVMRLLSAPADTALMLTSSVAGTLTVGVVYILARNNYGREAGIVAGILIALADYHISFSRAGLTDVTFCLFFLLALMSYIRAEKLENFSWAIVAGILTGLAWNTKYHGWLAGVVAGTALLPYLLQRDWRRFRAGFSKVLTAAFAATVVYLPWVLYIETQEGGYLYLAEYQSGFLQSARVLQNIIAHVRSQYYLDGWSGMLAPLLGLVAAAISCRRKDGTIFMLGVALLLGGVALGESIVVFVLAMLGLVVLLLNKPGYGQSVLISFFLVFTLLSPFYRPYARLLLPLMCASYILGSIGLVFLVQNRISIHRIWPPGFQLLSLGIISIALAFMIISTGMPERGHTYLPSTGFATAVEEIIPHIPENSDVMVIGEPAAVFYLRNHGYKAVHLDKPEDMYMYFPPGITVYLVCGRYACHFQEDWFVNYPGALVSVNIGTVRDVSDIRLFDDMSPWAALQWNKSNQGDYDLHLFRLKIQPFHEDP